MTIAESKNWRVTVSTNLPPIDAEMADLDRKNVGMIAKILTFSEPDGLEGHTVRHFFGDTVPDNTDYPDTVAPIGSEFCHLKVSGAGVVTGASKYLKTAAATWTVMGSVVA